MQNNVLICYRKMNKNKINNCANNKYKFALEFCNMECTM